MDTRIFQARRARLIERMGSGIAVIPTAPERARNRDSQYPYRFDSYFHYLSGFDEPESVLLLIAGDTPQAILFCRNKDVDKEIWDGFRWGPAAACETFAFDAAYPIGVFDAKLAELMPAQPSLHYSIGYDASWDKRIAAALNAVRAQTRSGKQAPAAIHDVRATLDDMRLIKDDAELAIMRRAAAISAQAHRRAMLFTAPGRREYEVEAELLHEFRRNGSQAPAYTSIVAGGANTCVLHYVRNDQLLRDGDLVLIDAGCEVDGYASDITRTFPVNGRFESAQADVYAVVLSAQEAAVAAIRPGAAFSDVHDAALRMLAQGMIDLKLLSGSIDSVLETETYKRFFMHRTSHWLGMDVHDAGQYKHGEQWRALRPGMMLTVEPGFYVRPGDDVPAAFWNIGIRIEDDALVTASGCELITADAPKAMADIEALMRDRSDA